MLTSYITSTNVYALSPEIYPYLFVFIRIGEGECYKASALARKKEVADQSLLGGGDTTREDTLELMGAIARMNETDGVWRASQTSEASGRR